MDNANSLETQAHLLRLKLNQLRHDINKHRTPLELRIARTLFEDRHRTPQHPVPVPKSNRNSNSNSNNSNPIRQRPAWGSGGGDSGKPTPKGGYSKKQIFATPSQIHIEYDAAVLVGRPELQTNENNHHRGPKWHCVIGNEAPDILMKQSNKRLGKAYEYLKQQSLALEGPALTASQWDNRYHSDEEQEEEEEDNNDDHNDHNNHPPPSQTTIEPQIQRPKPKIVAPHRSGYIPMRANATSADVLQSEAHRWLQRGRTLLQYRLEQVSNRIKEHEQNVQKH